MAEDRHSATESQDLDSVCDLEHVRHVVADQHHGHTAVANAPDHVEHVLGLDHAERSRGLVHDDHATCPRRRPRNSNALTLTAREVGDSGIGVLHRNSKILEGGLGAGLHGAFVEHAELAEDSRPQQLAAHVDVGGAVEVGRKRQVLVDGLDPELLGRCGRADLHGLSVEEQLAAVGMDDPGDDLRQRALAGAVVADQRHDLRGVDREAGALERVHVPVGLDDVARLEDWSGLVPIQGRRGGRIGHRASPGATTGGNARIARAAPRQRCHASAEGDERRCATRQAQRLVTLGGEPQLAAGADQYRELRLRA